MTATMQAPVPAVKQDRVAAARGAPVSRIRPSPRHPDGQGPGDHDPYDLLIIGAGPAGLVAARGAAVAGARTALIESRHIGGNCLNEGCIPSKTILRSAQLIAEMRNAPNYGVSSPVEVSVDFAAVMARMRRVRDRILRVDSAARLRDEGIDLHVGHARFVGADAVAVDGTRLRFRKALIATGARPLLPDIDGLAAAGYLSNETVFELTTLPPSLLVIGGGPLGCELSQAFARFGSRTLICHSEPLFLPKEERDAAQMVSHALARDGVEIHLYDNPLLKRPLALADVKHMLLGHWGTTPGQNFIYVHLNRVIKKYDLDMIYVSGPGHGAPAVVGNTYLEGTYSEVYPNISQDEAGLKKLFKQFSFPGGIPSHASPECPGSIHEGGELGYSLSHSFGAVFDNPDLIVACVVGDGEAETGPLATAWHSNKFLGDKGPGSIKSAGRRRV